MTSGLWRRSLSAGLPLVLAVGVSGCGQGASKDSAAPQPPSARAAQTAAAAPAVAPGTARGRIDKATVEGVMPGYFVARADGEGDGNALYRADGTQVDWYPDNGELSDVSLVMANDHGLFVTGVIGAGGLSGGSQILAEVEPETGQVDWSLDVGVTGVSEELLLTRTESDWVAYSYDGKEAFRAPRTPATDLQKRHAMEYGNEVSDTEDRVEAFDSDTFVTRTGSGFTSDVFHIRSTETGALIESAEHTGNEWDPWPPSLLAVLPEKDPLFKKDTGARKPLRLPNGDSVVTTDSAVERRSSGGDVLWSVEADGAWVMGATEERVAVSGPTGDLVLMDASDGTERGLVPDGTLGRCSRAHWPSASLAVFECDGADAEYLALVAS